MPAFVLRSPGLDKSIGSMLYDFGVPIEIMQGFKPAELDQRVPSGIFIIVNLHQRHISFDLKNPVNDAIWEASNYEHFLSLCHLTGTSIPKPKRHNAYGAYQRMKGKL